MYKNKSDASIVCMNPTEITKELNNVFLNIDPNLVSNKSRIR